jgi:hypothetical protein
MFISKIPGLEFRQVFKCRLSGLVQSRYIEVAQGAIFMEQNRRLGLILGRLAILKRKILVRL